MSSVAVVILNWNGKGLMQRYLPQVIQNTPKTVDIVVADNASTDGSLEMLASDFQEVKTIILDKNYGFAGGYNRAVAQLQHDYVVLLNSDVAPDAGWIEPLIALMDADDTIAACAPKILDDKDHTRFEYAGAAGGFLDRYCYPFCRGRVMDDIETDSGQYNENTDTLWVSGAALMIRRKEYLENGGLDEDFFAHMEEIDLCWRLRNKGRRIVACGESRVFHLGGATLSSTNPQKTYLNFRNNLSMLIKNYNTGSWWLVLWCRLMLDGVAGMKYLFTLKPKFCWAIIRAHWNVFFHFRGILRKRKILKNSRLRQLPPEIRRYSMLWRSIVDGRKTFGEFEKK
ncbi:MAG: glycosyltransferase family 2 protein [Bacteroidales bacterium]|nr:glycosyltransferase family 2 protein [Bacteroidales bacterium]